MRKKAKKSKAKMKKEPKPLKDFDIVAHVITLSLPQKVKIKEAAYKSQTIHALYLNRYGLEIGALMFNEQSGEFWSCDPFIWEEYLFYREEWVQENAMKKSAS